MAKEIIWETNWRGEKYLSADEFVRQKEALSPRDVTLRSSGESCEVNAPGAQHFTNGGLTVEISEGANPAPIKFPNLRVAS